MTGTNRSSRRTQLIDRPLHRAIVDYAKKLGYFDMLRLNQGEPDFETPVHIIQAAKKALDEGFTKYTDERGALALREAIAIHLKDTRGLEVSSDGILVTLGAAEAIDVVFSTLLDEKDQVVLPSIHYPQYLVQLFSSGLFQDMSA